MIVFPTFLNQIVLTLSDLGYETFYVGGCVRDALLGIETVDIDISTEAPIDVLIDVFGNNKLNVNEALGALSFHIDGFHIEITRFRKELEYLDGRRPSKLSFECDAREDILRRDFTINGLLYHPSLGLIDYVGGKSDLNKGTLRCIGEPELKFNQDYLRMLRLFRFKAQFGFSVDEQTLSSCVSNYHKLGLYNKRTWRDEFFKLLMAKDFVTLVLNEPWIITTLIPELGEAVLFNQRNPYHKYSLYEHSLYVVDTLVSLDKRLVGIFHDLGKLRTQVIIGDRASYPNHANAGMEIAKDYLLAWDIEKTRRNKILDLIKYHDMSLDTDYIEFKKKVSDFGLEFMRDIITIKRSDNLAKSELAYYQVDKCDVFSAFIEKIEKEKPVLHVSQLAIKGNDINFDEDKRGLILNDLLIKVIEGRIENTYEALLNEVGGIGK